MEVRFQLLHSDGFGSFIGNSPFGASILLWNLVRRISVHKWIESIVVTIVLGRELSVASVLQYCRNPQCQPSEYNYV